MEALEAEKEASVNASRIHDDQVEKTSSKLTQDMEGMFQFLPNIDDGKANLIADFIINDMGHSDYTSAENELRRLVNTAGRIDKPKMGLLDKTVFMVLQVQGGKGSR